MPVESAILLSILLHALTSRMILLRPKMHSVTLHTHMHAHTISPHAYCVYLPALSS